MNPQPESKTKAVEPTNGEEFNRQYDLTPLAAEESKKTTQKAESNRRKSNNRSSAQISYPVDPWEITSPESGEMKENSIFFPSSFSHDSDSVEQYVDEVQSDDYSVQDYDNDEIIDHGEEKRLSRRSTFLKPSEIHPRMEEREDDIAQLRLLAGQLNADWGAQDFMAPALARRIRDFQFAQEKRRKKYGNEKPWGILGLYEHLAAIRIDVEWAEDAAWRRANGEP
jgi:hypothetical protein